MSRSRVWMIVFAMLFTAVVRGWYLSVSTWDRVLVVFVMVLDAIAFFEWAWQSGLEHPAIMELKNETPKPEKIKTNFNSGEMIYQQVTEAPTFDIERLLAFQLVRRIPHFGFDLTEAFWLPRLKCSRKVFVGIVGDWLDQGIIVKKNRHRNSPYVLKSWDKLQKKARGE